MKFLIQVTKEASVEVDGTCIGRIGKGFLVFIGVEESDTEEICERMVKKMTALRIFEDDQGKTNLNLDQAHGELLLVSQFTLYADCRKGNRPSFIRAGSPEKAERLYRYAVAKCREAGYHTEEGSFGADMKVSLINDGPFTVMLDSHELFGN